jgi:hypothetical protein
VFVPVFAFLLFCVCVQGPGSRPGIHGVRHGVERQNEVFFLLFFFLNTTFLVLRL